MELFELRKSVKKLLIDLDLDARGCRSDIARSIGINKKSLSMALTGYRNTPGSKRILETVKVHLETIFNQTN